MFFRSSRCLFWSRLGLSSVFSFSPSPSPSFFLLHSCAMWCVMIETTSTQSQRRPLPTSSAHFSFSSPPSLPRVSVLLFGRFTETNVQTLSQGHRGRYQRDLINARRLRRKVCLNAELCVCVCVWLQPNLKSKPCNGMNSIPTINVNDVKHFNRVTCWRHWKLLTAHF